MSDIYDNKFEFKSAFKIYPQEGNLVYEYNPFYNYRLDHDMIYYKERLWEMDDLADELGIYYDANTNAFYTDAGYSNIITSWYDVVPKTETIPVTYQKGQLVDFDTDELSFSLNNPVQLLAQYSYDDSVNLVINDGLNPPRLVNSRFSATERNKYQVCNRKGNNDSNIYDQGDQFDIDTSLYKKINKIPILTFSGITYGGNLKIGNYHFYFRYVDEDDNYSDFFAESGLVSVFIGNSADSIHSGFRDENSHKMIKFTLNNTDPGYTKVVAYYTRATSDVNQNMTVSAYRIDRKFLIADSYSTVINITGFEDVDEVSIEDINPTYQIYGSVETQAAAQNMLFLGNVDKPKLDYDDFSDCALRFLPYVDASETYNTTQIGYDYLCSINNTYYDPDYIYNYTGYHYNEMYRFGIVFILQDNTLSDVYNVRGRDKVDGDFESYTQVDFYVKDEDGNDTDQRNYVTFDEQYYNIQNENGDVSSTINLENAKGVVRISDYPFNSVIGIKFTVEKKVIDYLVDTLKVKGFFFVRQKRIPTTICQAFMIGVDKESHTPMIPYDGKFWTESFITSYEQNGSKKKNESSESRQLQHSVTNRKRSLDEYEVYTQGAICPEYDVNSPYLNTLFTGTKFKARKVQTLNVSNSTDMSYEVEAPTETPSDSYTTVRVQGVEDNVKLVAIGDYMFSARAGEAEEAFRFEFIGEENKDTYADNLLRGSFGPYLGITGYDNACDLVDIKIPDYSEGNMQEYFEIRYHDKSPFYAISYRYDLSRLSKWSEVQTVEIKSSDETKSTDEREFYIMDDTMYRGDCYICQFTHRLNRNFQDPSAPANDKIVDPDCWQENFEYEDDVLNKENFDDINLGDVNAIKLGMYITLFVRSSINLNVRALDESNVDEATMFGHGRGFYPYYAMNNSGAYKIPEALCYNKGFEKSVSERINMEVPDVPWIKNEFSNRIAYSNIQVKDAFVNGWRTFMGTHYRDYPKTYGSITKLVELNGSLLCVFEHGVATIPVNERAVAGEGAGGYAYINTSNVLPENPNVLNGVFGSQWRESVIKTDNAVYGVDTVGRKIWKTNGQQFEVISDFVVNEFLNDNISLSERELEPVIGVRNVKTHFNRFKNDVMFTFYDNLYGFEERVWNLCYNEAMQKWITFYSWVPSYSENIYNQYFSFDRNTSKWIAKLGVSHHGNDFADGVTLESNTILEDGGLSATLYLDNRTLPIGDDVSYEITYSLERDNYGNYEKFKIVKYDADGNELDDDATEFDHQCLEFIGDYDDVTSEFYERDENNAIVKDDRGRRIWLDQEDQKNPDKVVLLLNIRADITIIYSGQTATLEEAYATGYTDRTYSDGGYYESVVAVIPEYNMQFLTTDFWKHGKAGIIDIADDIYPTYWYGKQHPFEFEFIVNEDPQAHKIFDNLQIISNNAEPESFHYEIIGDCFDFAKDKKNMYIRQEATKELYQYNGCDVTYDHDYDELEAVHRPIDNLSGWYEKSTLMPLWYSRQDTINEIEDYYHLKDDENTKDFSALSGGEITRYETRDEYRIWSHAKAVSIQDKGRIRGNMHYREDQWYVQINPINVVYKNEKSWDQGDLLGREVSADKIPIELGQSPIPDEVLAKGNINEDDIPENSQDRGIVTWDWTESQMREVKLKDKWIKIRIRYTGDKLAIIAAIKTMYSISYS